jgi:hypothetical protein
MFVGLKWMEVEIALAYNNRLQPWLQILDKGGSELQWKSLQLITMWLEAYR